ncbi:flippase [Clostridium saudiense]|uniref:flippase n=1 Tax=Clostridium saudiense TaxID=1414720 RepID=UPI00266EB63A|nr:flippase [Clostridium saudiense]
MIEKKSSIKKNFAYQLIYEILVLILPFITSPYIARVIGAEGLGIYSYTYSVAYYFVLFSLLGIKNYGNRSIAKIRDNRNLLNETFTNILSVHILISIICCIAYGIYVFELKEDRVLATIQGFYVLSGLFDISWFYFGIERFKMTVSRNIIIKIINVICVFTFVKESTDIWKYCAIMAIGSLVSQLTLWIPLKRYIKFVKPEWKNMKIHLKPLFILFIPAIAVSLYKYMDKIMLGIIGDKIQLGYYENAEKVINIPMTIIASFGTVMLPKMCNLATEKNKKLESRYISLSIQFVMCLAFALAFGLSSVGRVFAPIFWGDNFEFSGNIIMGLSTTIPFIAFANVIRTQYLIPNERDKEYLLSVIVGAIVNLVINWILIPRYGAMGATIATIIAEVIVCMIQVLAVRKELDLLKYIKSFYVFIFIGIIMFIGVYSIGIKLGNNITTLFIQIIFGGTFYCTMSGLYFYLTKNEVFIKAIRNMEKRFN